MEFYIDHYGWGQTGPFPKVKVDITSEMQQIVIHFDVFEKELRAVHAVHNEAVHEDSCVEFFACLYPSDPRYINIEINPIGTVHFGFGMDRYDRELLSFDCIHSLGVQTTVDRSGEMYNWTVDYAIPYDLITKIYGKESALSSDAIRCNFFKCGALLQAPHYGSWKPVGTEQPDFHRSGFFGEVNLKDND